MEVSKLFARLANLGTMQGTSSVAGFVRFMPNPPFERDSPEAGCPSILRSASWVGNRRVDHEQPRENPVQDRPQNALVRGVADRYRQGAAEANSAAGCRVHVVCSSPERQLSQDAEPYVRADGLPAALFSNSCAPPLNSTLCPRPTGRSSMSRAICLAGLLALLSPESALGGERMPWEEDADRQEALCENYGDNPELNNPSTVEYCLSQKVGIFSALRNPDCSIHSDTSKALTASQVSACISMHYAKIGDFFAKWQIQHQEAAGIAILVIMASPDGKITTVTVAGESTIDPEFSAALAEFIKDNIVLPASSSSSNLRYPFRFQKSE